MKQYLLLIISFLPFLAFSQQVKLILTDQESKSPVVGVEVTSARGQSTFTDEKGEVNFEGMNFPTKVFVKDADYFSDSLTISSAGIFSWILKPIKAQSLDNIVVTASRRGQRVEDVPISMEILKPALINNKGITNIEQALDQTPGVFSMDGQVSIRGGSGFAYGAGSRVMPLWNDMPMITADAGDVKWNTFPLELSSKIEVIKGASSVLYGSGALNGIISVSEIVPTEKPYYRAKIQFGIYDKPQRLSLRRNQTLTNQMAEFAHGQKKGNFFYNIALHMFNDQGFREGEIEKRVRLTGSMGYNFKKVRGLQAGVGYSIQLQRIGSFLIWESDSLGYRPQGGADISVPGSSLSVMNGLRLMIDPYIKYVGRNNFKQTLKGRMYNTNNQSLSNTSQSSRGTTYYVDYIAQKDFGNNFNLTAGATYTRTDVRSNMFGNHYADNVAAYTQLDKKVGKFTFTGGVRFEYFKQDNTPIDSYLYLKKDSSAKVPVYPILRAAVTYKVSKSTTLRASFGQGVRYPATSERFIMTSAGALNIFPNSNLKREQGYAGEIGVKQVFLAGKSWKGMLDVAAFINQYKNMTEFTFGIYNPSNVQLTTDPNAEGYFAKWIGFRAENAEEARIMGVEASFASEGKIGDVTLRTLVGYTYMNPKSLNNNPNYTANFSDTTQGLLKYRFKHLAKADVEVEYKKFSIGFSARYNSHMANIDKIFEDGLLGIEILKGLKSYREKHNKGALVFDARVGYDINEHFRVGLIANNIFNREYMGRPGDIQAPRNFAAQLMLKF